LKVLGGILVFALSVCLWSCRTVAVGTYEKKENMRPAKLIENVLDNTPNYKKASFKFSVEYSFGDIPSNGFGGIVRVSRDSLMWVSIRSLNIEGARMLISSDSVMLMDRINNQYYAEDISALEKLLNIDLTYDDLQSIMLNEYFCYTGDTTKMHQCLDTVYYCVKTVSDRRANRVAERIERTNGGYAERHETVVQTIKVVPETFKIKSVFIEDFESGRNAFVEYDKFVKYGEFLFPQEIKIMVDSGDFSGKIEFSLSDFEINDELTFPFKIPSKYIKTSLNGKNR